MKENKLRHRWIIWGSLCTGTVVFIAWFSVLMTARIEELCIAATTRALIFHPQGVVQWYLNQLATIKPDFRTDTGLTLLQFTLNGCEERDGANTRSVAMTNCLATADILRRRGVPIDERDRQFGFTALHNAVMTRDADVAKWLLENGANPNILAEGGAEGAVFTGMTPLGLAQYLLRKRDSTDGVMQEVVAVLKASGARDITPKVDEAGVPPDEQD